MAWRGVPIEQRTMASIANEIGISGSSIRSIVRKDTTNESDAQDLRDRVRRAFTTPWVDEICILVRKHMRSFIGLSLVAG